MWETPTLDDSDDDGLLKASLKTEMCDMLKFSLFTSCIIDMLYKMLPSSSEIQC